MSWKKKVGVFAITGLMVPSVAAAQSGETGVTDAPVQIPAVTVSGQGETVLSPVTGYVAGQQATGTKTDTPPYRDAAVDLGHPARPDRGPERADAEPSRALHRGRDTENLLNKEHVSSCYYGEWCAYGYERTVTAGLRYRW